jgi:hypothetical protein
MKYSFFTALVLLVPVLLMGQSKYASDSLETRALSERVAKTFFEQNPRAGLTELQDYTYSDLPNGLSKVKFSGMASTFEKFDHWYANPQTYFLASTEKLETIGLKYVYIVQYQRRVIKLSFIYLKASEGWYLGDFEKSENYQAEFK